MLTGTSIINIDMTVSDAGQRYMNHKVSSRGGGHCAPINVHTIKLLSVGTGKLVLVVQCAPIGKCK